MNPSKRARGEVTGAYKPRKVSKGPHTSKGNGDEHEEDETVMWSQDSPNRAKGVRHSPRAGSSLHSGKGGGLFPTGKKTIESKQRRKGKSQADSGAVSEILDEIAALPSSGGSERLRKVKALLLQRAEVQM